MVLQPPTTIDAIKEQLRVIRWSFKEELAALLTTLHQIKDYNPTICETVLINTDSKYLLEAFQGRNACSVQMWPNFIQAHIIIQSIQ